MRALLLAATLLLAACGRAAPVDAGTPGAGFPHPADYKDGPHGTDALAAGATCLTCHTVAEGELKNGAVPTAPACQSCHVYPHDAGFSAGETHGPAWLAKDAPCADCHGEDGTREPAGQADGRCVSCHTTYPHPPKWEAPEVHGAAVLARGGDAACLTCHGATGDAMPGRPCAECHAAYPHPDGWREGAHGVAWREATGDERCGKACHPVAPDPDSPRLSCQGCHDLFPHAEGFAATHLVTAQNRGSLTCQNCHADGDQPGPVLPVTCAPACHAGGAK